MAKKRKYSSIQSVKDKCICCGCGACQVVCPQKCIQFEYGERYNFPCVDMERCIQCGLCLKVCPSAHLLYGQRPDYPILTEWHQWRDRDCYLTYSTDDEIRMNSSSGGFITGLILHLIETGWADGGIVARCGEKKPLIAESIIATDRVSILSSQGSKYAPVSNCTVLAEVLERPGRYVFVGTPCMCEALHKLQKLLPIIRHRIVLSIAFVCAGMASRKGTQSYIENIGKVNLADVSRIAYRGNGWPGRFLVFGKDGKVLMDRPLIGGSLQNVVPYDHYLRCWNCVDHWGRFADIVVSDPWTEEMVKKERKGLSAILVHTTRGKEPLKSAIDSGAIISNQISLGEMLGYNKYFVIGPKHPRHAWMALYQLIFFGRVSKELLSVLRCFLKKQGVGIMTTLRARFAKRYYY